MWHHRIPGKGIYPSVKVIPTTGPFCPLRRKKTLHGLGSHGSSASSPACSALLRVMETLPGSFASVCRFALPTGGFDTEERKRNFFQLSFLFRKGSIRHGTTVCSAETKTPASPAARMTAQPSGRQVLRPGCPGTCTIEKAGLECRDLPASASQTLGLKDIKLELTWKCPSYWLPS